MYDMQIGYHWNRKTFTSVSDFLQVMFQLTFWLIPIPERSTVGYSIFFIVLDKVFLVTLYQRRLYGESRNFTLIRGTVLWILYIPKVLFKQPWLIHPVVRYSGWKDWKGWVVSPISIIKTIFNSNKIATTSRKTCWDISQKIAKMETVAIVAKLISVFSYPMLFKMTRESCCFLDQNNVSVE